ncbi:MAG: phosphopantetheine-binding protein [Anaerococcus sp.]|jgi:acyl carrier protein|nr:phosphopantetheine-binding protein [Peptoniphilaceae bacterium]MDY3056036.1 phosphopantetheine-binding protein [Anaerococcus sp.]
MLREELKELAGENLDIDVENLDFATKIDDLDIDSIDLLDFIMSIEEKYDIEFSDDELDQIDSLEDIVAIIEKKK